MSAGARLTRRAGLAGVLALAATGPVRAREAGDDGRLTARPAVPGAWTLPPGLHKAGLDPDRDALLYLSSTLDRDRPAPLLVAFHGASHGAADALGQFRAEASRRGVVLLAIPSRGVTWAMEGGAVGPDAAFVDRALAWAFAACRIDPARIAVAGFSDGAAWAVSLGVQNGDLFSDVLAFSVTRYHVRTPAGRPRMFFWHGRDDMGTPLAWGESTAEIFRRAGYDVEFHSFPGGHWLTPDAVRAGLKRFLS